MSEKTIEQLETAAEAARLRWRAADKRSVAAHDRATTLWYDYTAAVAKLKQAKREGAVKG